MPGEQPATCRAWTSPSSGRGRTFDPTLRLQASINRGLTDSHKLTLVDVRLPQFPDNSGTGSARMGDLADARMSLPSRVTRQIRRLEAQGLVSRTTRPRGRPWCGGRHHRRRA